MDIATIQKRFKTDAADSKELLDLHAKGVDYGRRGVPFDSDEYEDDAQFDIEHLETLLDLPDDATLRLFRAGYREGQLIVKAEHAAAKRTMSKRRRASAATAESAPASATV